MSFLDKQAQAIKASWQPQSIEELDRHISTGGGSMTSTGRFVSEQSALSLIEVQKCTNVLARVEGCLETKVYKWADTAHRKKDEAWAHPLWERLVINANDETDAQSFTETESLFLSLHGNFAAEIVRNSSRNRNITEINQWLWWDVKQKRDMETGELYYEHREDNKWVRYPKERVFHINTMGWNGITGLSTIGTAREAIAGGLSQTDFYNLFYRNGMNIGMVFSNPNPLSEEARKNMKEAAKEMGGGLMHAWEPFILEEGTKWERVPMSFVDAQFIDMMKLSKLDIDGLFGVPPPLVGNSFEGLTYTNIEQMPLYFTLFTMLPIVTRRERMINWKLLTPQDREAGYFAKTNILTLLRADAKTRAEYFKNKIQNGGMSPNDWNLADDENPYDDKSADRRFLNGNARTIEQVVENDIGTKNTSNPNQNGGEKEDEKVLEL